MFDVKLDIYIYQKSYFSSYFGTLEVFDMKFDLIRIKVRERKKNLTGKSTKHACISGAYMVHDKSISRTLYELSYVPIIQLFLTQSVPYTLLCHCLGWYTFVRAHKQLHRLGGFYPNRHCY